MAELSGSQSKNKRTGKQGSGHRITNRSTRSSRTWRQAGSSSVPPVMVRGGLSGWVLDSPKRKKSKLRRRFDLAWGANGAEMRLPGIPQVAIGWRFVSGLLMTALLALLFHLWNSPMYQINQLEINGLRRLDTRDVAAILGLNGETIFSVDVDEFEQRLADTFPEFSAVTVEVGLPAAVEISVEERRPIITWLQDGRTLLVDANGIAFPKRSDEDQVPPLMVSASVSPSGDMLDEESQDTATQFIPVEMVSAILSMSGHAPSGSALVYDQLRGLGWRDAQGWDVYFGDVRDMGQKLILYNAIAEKINEEDITPALVSVEHIHNPYYRIDK